MVSCSRAFAQARSIWMRWRTLRSAFSQGMRAYVDGTLLVVLRNAEYVEFYDAFSAEPRHRRVETAGEDVPRIAPWERDERATMFIGEDESTGTSMSRPAKPIWPWLPCSGEVPALRPTEVAGRQAVLRGRRPPRGRARRRDQRGAHGIGDLSAAATSRRHISPPGSTRTVSYAATRLEQVPARLRIVPYVPDLRVLLTDGCRVESKGIVYLLRPHELGPVVLPTGKIVGCDPLTPDTTPFVDIVAPGRYQLRAWVAVLHKDGSEWKRRVAALQLVVADETAASWTMALLPDQDLASLGDDGLFGYGVDSGAGTLADQIAIEALIAWDYEHVERVFIPAHIPDDPIEAVIAAVVDERTGANVYVVGSGRGDGVYATYVGRTEDGQITSFVTDFRVVPLG
jgi:hypothetical protein